MSRRRYVVCYDVREPVRLRRTHDVMMGYGDPLQYSVFLCDLSPAELVLLESDLRRVVKLSDDSVMIVDLGPATGIARRRIRALGKGRLPEGPRAIVV
jgi:CRISPR-associated protein Cas2